jgi:hypothetical protein
MKKLFVAALIVSSFCIHDSFAKTTTGEMDKCQVTSSEAGTLVVETKTKMTITVKDAEGKFILSEFSNADSGKLQLLGLSTGYYEVEIKNKKSSKIFRVEVL